jgi:hypothetical protein
MVDRVVGADRSGIESLVAVVGQKGSVIDQEVDRAEQ